MDRVFAEISTRCSRPGGYLSVDDPWVAICDDVWGHYAFLKPFIGSRTADGILCSEGRAPDACAEDGTRGLTRDSRS